jgi:hypothetical protein
MKIVVNNSVQIVKEALEVNRSHLTVATGLWPHDKMPGWNGKTVTAVLAELPVDEYPYPITSPDGAPFRADNVQWRTGYVAKPVPDPEDPNTTFADFDTAIDESVEVFGSIDQFIEVFNEEGDKKLTPQLTKQRDKLVKKLHKHIDAFDKRYGTKAHDVMYGLATKAVLDENIVSEAAAQDPVPVATRFNHSYAKYASQSNIEQQPADAAAARILGLKYSRLAKVTNNPTRQVELKQTATRFYDSATRLSHRHTLSRKRIASEAIEVDTIFDVLNTAIAEPDGIEFELPTGGSITLTPETATTLKNLYPEWKYTEGEVLEHITKTSKTLIAETIQSVDPNVVFVGSVFDVLNAAITESEGIEFQVSDGNAIVLTPKTASMLKALYPEEKYTEQEVLEYITSSLPTLSDLKVEIV